MDLQDFFQVPLIDLGTRDDRLAGVFMPASEIGSEKIGITDQFLANAAAYHDKYDNPAQFRTLFERAFAAGQAPTGKGLKILDMGAGAGANTVGPCLDLFEDCEIVATDLSPQSLGMLRSFVVAAGLERRIGIVCSDATCSGSYRSGVFDLVIGASILHHLLDPARAITAASHALKPGGMAVFFEPFEGFALIRAAFELILRKRDESGLPLDERVADFLKVLILDFSTRARSDRSAEFFKHMDDKWLFTRTYLERVGRAAGFDSVDCVPLHGPEWLFRRLTTDLLRIGANLKETDLPDWAWSYVDLFDQSLSDDMKRDVLTEAAVIFRKGRDVDQRSRHA